MKHGEGTFQQQQGVLAQETVMQGNSHSSFDMVKENTL